MKAIKLTFIMLWFIGFQLSAQPVYMSSEYGNYTIETPQNSKAVLNFTQVLPDADYVIAEKASVITASGGKFEMDVWLTTELDIDDWMKKNSQITGFAPSDCKEVKATLSKLKAYRFDMANDNQQNCIEAYDFTQVLFLQNGKVYRLTYTHSDWGASVKEFDHLVGSFMFGLSKNSIKMNVVQTDELETMTKNVNVTCGGYADNACGGTNPFPCCGNGGNCTWWAWREGRCAWGVSLPVSRHAKYWAGDLSANGYPVSATPVVGSIACSTSGDYGHVAWVIAVSGSQVQVREMNCCTNCNYGMRQKWYSTSFFNAGFVTNKGGLKLTSALSYTPSPIVQYNSLTGTATVYNNSATAWSGSIALALHSTADVWLGDIQRYDNQSIAAWGSKTYTFTKSSITSTPGTSYQLHLKAAPSSNLNSWSLINKGSYTNPVNVSISGGGGGVGCTTLIGSQYPSSTLTPTTTSQIASCLYGGEYARFYVTSGSTYLFSLCSTDGGSSPDDSELTLKNDQGTGLMYSDDVCGSAAKIQWTATFTGYIKVLVSLYKCTTNSTCHNLAYRKISKSGDIADTVAVAIPNELSVDVFPSPASHTLNVSVRGVSGESSIELVNALGELVLQSKINDSNTSTFNIAALPKGLYIVRVQNGDVVSNQKVIIE